MKSGVYMIEHRESGKKYVGSAAWSFASRWNQHRHDLRKGKHKNSYLQRAWDKYGEDAFEFRVIEPCLPEHATGVEQVFIDWYKSADPEFGYNNCPTAGSRFGSKASDETKAKQSVAMMGNKHGLGRKPTQEATDKRVKKILGRKNSVETLAKMSVAHKGHSRHTAESRAKLSAAALGRGHTADARAKISAGLTGRKCSAETRAKISAAAMGNKRNLGRKVSAETRAKISAAKKKRYAEMWTE